MRGYTAFSLQAGYSSVGRASDCRLLQQSDGPWFDSGWPDFENTTDLRTTDPRTTALEDTARLARSVERKALNLVVEGSSPTVGVLSMSS